MKNEDIDLDPIMSIVEGLMHDVNTLCQKTGLLNNHQVAHIMKDFFESVKDFPPEDVTSALFLDILIEEDVNTHSELMNILTILYIRASYLLSEVKSGYPAEYLEALHENEYESMSYILEQGLIQDARLIPVARKLAHDYSISGKVAVLSPYYRKGR